MLSIKDDHGCMDSLPFKVASAVPVFIHHIDIIDPVCIAKDGEIHITPNGGTGRILFSIDGIHFHTQHDFYNLEPGSYKIEIMDEIGCRVSDQIEISDEHVLKLDRMITDSSGCGGKKGSITLIASGDPVIFTLNENITQSSPTFTDLLSGDYAIAIIGKDGCRLDTTAQVAQEKCPIYIPNTFSPNGDGVNDFFQFSTYGNFNVLVQKYLIFDRWGNLTYSAGGFPISSPEFWWDGTSKKMNVGPGVFSYFIEVRYDDGSTDIFKGEVTLVK
jgi:gliding motility-associated-like protein